MVTTSRPHPTAALSELGLQRLLGLALSAVLVRQGDMLAIKDLGSGLYLHANPAMAAFLGRPLDAVLGHSDPELFEAALLPALRAAEQTATVQGQPLISEHRFEWMGKRREFTVMRLLGQPDAEGPQCMLSVWFDARAQREQEAQLRLALEQIEQQQQANELLRREIADQALRDPSSGLYRRAHFEDQLRREVDLSTREHRDFAVVFIHLDPFSSRVLALGDAGQQRVLEAMGRLLRGGTRAMDASCRFDEHRFAVLLSGVGLATAHSRMESLRRKCAAHIVVHDGQELGFSVAMGVASFPHTALSLDGLVGACESALAEAQRRGGNQVTLAAIPFDAV